MPKIAFDMPVNADLQTIWNVLLDKIEHPERYQAGVEATRFPESTDTYAIREIQLPDNTVVKERITIDERMGEVRYELLDDAMFTGEVKNNLIPPAGDDPRAMPIVQFTMDWRPRNKEAMELELEFIPQLEASIQEGVRFIKDLAEHMQTQQAAR